MATISTTEHDLADAETHPRPTDFGAFRKPTYTIPRATKDLGGLAGRLPEIWSVWGRHSIAPAFREALMVSVAHYNGCRFCAFAHVEWALAEDVSGEELAELAGISAGQSAGQSGGHIDRDRWIAYAWANELVGSGFGDVSEELSREMAARYSSGERRQLDTIARVMTFMNLSGNTFDALLSRRNRRPAPGSRLIDELVVGGAFVAAIPPVAIFLSAKRRKSPLRLMRELARFSTRFTGPAV